MQNGRKKSKRIMGMTPSQLIMVGGMLVVLCCLLGVAGYVVFFMDGGSTVGLPAAPAPTLTLVPPSLTPLPPTARPTEPPVFTPTVTAMAVATNTMIPLPLEIPADWKRFSNDGVEIRVPPTWDGGIPATEWADIIARMRKVSDGFNRLADDLKDDPQPCGIWAYDQGESAEITLTELCINKITNPQEYLAKKYKEAVTSKLPTGLLIEYKEYQIDAYSAYRVVMEYSQPNTNVTWWFSYNLIYDGKTYWELFLGTHINQYLTRYPDFEKIIHTFHILE